MKIEIPTIQREYYQQYCTAFTSIDLRDTTLDLSNNRFGLFATGYNINPLARIFANIPSHITSLILEKCLLHYYSANQEEFSKAIEAIPHNVTNINFSNNDFSNWDINHLIQAFSTRPEETSLQFSIDATPESNQNNFIQLLTQLANHESLANNICSVTLGDEELKTHHAAYLLK